MRDNGPQLFHVNFHTWHNRPVFEVPDYQALLEKSLVETLERWQIGCCEWQVMPTHLHLILISFPDMPLSTSLKAIKGATARAIFTAAPELRADLGDHLWQEGYDWVEITTNRQYQNTVRYVRDNRIRGGLE